MPQIETLRQRLRTHTRPAAPELVRQGPRGAIQCLACGHRCKIPPGHDGICKVRHHIDGQLRVPWGYVSGLAVDPIEKKPFFHVLPGAHALSFGMLGCDLHCAYCQNWLTSQTLRDPRAQAPMQDVDPAELTRLAREHRCPVVVSTYNEPLITAEWARAVFEPAREAGLLCGFVSNGNATPAVLDYLRPFVELYKVDLKSFEDRAYRRLGGTLANVLRTLEDLRVRGFWVEVVTLITPGFNDDEHELRRMAEHLAALDPDMPWHLTAFWPQYRMEDTPPTPVTTLERARRIGLQSGLHHVYAGNRPGAIEGGEDTFCPGCGRALIRRRGFEVLAQEVRAGRCPDCGRTIAGRWSLP